MSANNDLRFDSQNRFTEIPQEWRNRTGIGICPRPWAVT